MNPPNSPCECGSGKKQKKCHYFGAPLHWCQTYEEYKEDRRQAYLKTPAGRLESQRKVTKTHLTIATILAGCGNYGPDIRNIK